MSDQNHLSTGLSSKELFDMSMTRRAMLKKGIVAGLSIPAVSSILAACETDDADDGVVDETDVDDGDPAEATDDEDPAAEVTDDEAPDDEDPDVDDGDEEVAVDEDHESLFGEDYEPPENQGGQIVEGAFADAATVNGILTHDTASSRVISMITKTLIINHPVTTEPEPELAEDWEISDDGTEYVFNLREDVTWHDGEQFTSEDVVFTFETHMDPDTGSPRHTQLVDRIDSIEAPDDYTVQFTLNRPVSAFLQANLTNYIVPEHILGDVDPADLASHPYSTGEAGTTIGCGPFVFEEWISDDHVTLSAYEDFYRGRPNIDQWVRRIVPDQTVLAQQLGTGEIDYAGVEESDVQTLENQDNVNITTYDTFGFTYYAYQLDPERTTLFQEREVRQALLYALDREALIDAIRFGIGEVAVGTMPVASWAYNPDGIDRHYDYDPDRARELLAEAGWEEGEDGVLERDGERFSFELYTNSGNQIREQYVTVMQEQWREIGIECMPQTEEWNAFLERFDSTRDFEMILIGFSWGVDPDQETMWHTDAQEGGFNRVRYSNPEVDELLEQGLATTDPDERIEIYTEMQNIILDDLPLAILDFPQGIVGVNVRCHNIFPNDAAFTANAHEWWVDG